MESIIQAADADLDKKQVRNLLQQILFTIYSENGIMDYELPSSAGNVGQT